MNTATRHLFLGLALLLSAAPAWAQSDVVFQVDMNTAITNCAFTPGEDVVSVPGTFNNFDTGADPLSDDGTNGDTAAGDGIYATTLSLEDGPIEYKFWASDPLGWEDNQDTGSTNREYEVDGDATLPVADFFKANGIADQCDSETETYEVVFQVDMSVQINMGNFDPETDVVTVAGGGPGGTPGINGWNSSADTLAQDPFDPEIYVGLVTADLLVPSTQSYKYIIGEPGDAAPDGWENDPDKTFEVTGDETDQSGNGIPEVILPVRFFNNASPEDFLDAPATVTFNVDLRTAFQLLDDEGEIPANSAATEFTTTIGGLYINGPAVGQSNADDINDWADWGPDGLGSIETRALSDPDGDRIYTGTYEYDAGTMRSLTGKFGTDGFDNEAAGFNDHRFFIDPGTQTITVVFGCMRQEDGTFEDDNGPGGTGVYDPYALVDNTATPPTCMFVESGGEDDIKQTDVEGTGVVPVAAELRANYPNPFAGTTTFEYALPESGAVYLAVYDLTGRQVAVLVDAVQTADTYRVTFDAAGLASGVYVTRLRAGDTVMSQRLTVLN